MLIKISILFTEDDCECDVKLDKFIESSSIKLINFKASQKIDSVSLKSSALLYAKIYLLYLLFSFFQ